MSEFDQIIVFGKKSMSELFKEVYDTTKKKDKDITSLVDQLKELIQNIGDAVQLVPLISTYLDISVKNNEHIIKMLQIVQKAAQRSASADPDDKEMTKEEREALVASFNEFYKDVKNPVAKA
jgi:hypothetical protein